MWWLVKRIVLRPPCPIEFVFFLQRAFVEAHSIRPLEAKVERWIKTLRRVMWTCKYWPRGYYPQAHKHLFAPDGTPREDAPEYQKYVLLQDVKRKRKDTYDGYLDAAVELAAAYVQAAYELYRAPNLDDGLRDIFRDVVANADLGFPLELNVLATTQKSLSKLKGYVDKKWAEAAKVREWLEFVDECQHPESREAAAEQLVHTIVKEDFLKLVMATREPLGGVVLRELDSTRYVTRLPGDPDGEQVVVRFKTSFEKTQSAVEEVTMVLEENGKWRVFAYDIK